MRCVLRSKEKMLGGEKSNKESAEKWQVLDTLGVDNRFIDSVEIV